jgi:hypothetical protein
LIFFPLGRPVINIFAFCKSVVYMIARIIEGKKAQPKQSTLPRQGFQTTSNWV